MSISISISLFLNANVHFIVLNVQNAFYLKDDSF